MSEAQLYTVVYALVRPRQPNQARVDYAPSDTCYHHVANVTAAWTDEAIERCRRDTLPGFVFQLIAVFSGHVDRRAKGDGIVVHDFDYDDRIRLEDP